MNCTVFCLPCYEIGTWKSYKVTMSKYTNFKFCICSSFWVIKLVTKYPKSYHIVFEIWHQNVIKKVLHWPWTMFCSHSAWGLPSHTSTPSKHLAPQLPCEDEYGKNRGQLTVEPLTFSKLQLNYVKSLTQYLESLTYSAESSI